MEILKYTPEHHEFRQKVRAYFEDKIIPNIEQWEKDHIVPASVWKDIGEAGFLCTATPKEYGGHGLDFLYSVIMTEETGKSGFSGLTLGLHSDIVVPYIETFGTEEQKKKFLPGCVTGDIITSVAMTEPDTGSDLSSMTTTAVEDGDDIIIDGTKTFISNGLNTHLCVVAARDPAVDNPYEAISLYLVEGDRPGFERGRHLDKMGFNSQDTSELFFSKCRIPKENLLGEKGGGFIILMQKLQQERLICAIGAVVAAEQIVEKATQYCQQTTRNGKPMSKFQAVQFELVEMATEAKIARTFLDKLIAEHIEGENVVVEVSMSKFWTTDLANKNPRDKPSR